MGFFLTLILWAAMFALSQLLTPEPELENARPRTLDDFNFPTATEGRMIPLTWGRDKIKGPNVIWYGDLKTVAIREKVKVSMFNSKHVTTGYKYYVGFQMGICQGPAVLKKIWVGDELVWSGTQSTDGQISIKIRNMKGKFYFYTGTKTQARNSYLQEFQNPCPAYRSMCYGVWQGGYVGKQTSILPWSFEIERVPEGLGGGDHKVNSGDCNPMHMAYDIMTDTNWGYGYSSSEFDISDWQAAAATLKSEGNGMSLILASQRKATDILKEIEKQADCHFRIDPATGKWKVVLVRDGYSLSGLKDADVSSVNEVVEYSRGSWEGTTNIVRIAYKRRANYYTDGYTVAQDAANMQIQGRKVPVIYSYVGVRDDTLANKIAWREIRANSYPLAKIRFKGTRLFWDSFVGEVILFTWEFEDFSVTEIPFRIIRINAGTPEEPAIMIDAVQDVFSWRAASFSDPDASSWIVPGKDLIPFPALTQLAFEAPYAISRRDETPAEGRIWTVGKAPGRAEDGYEILQRNASGVPAGDFYIAGSVAGFTEDGELDGNIDNDDTIIDVLTDMHVNEIAVSTNTDTGEYLLNLFLIGDEMIACTGASEITDGLRLTGCLRGFCDTAQASHSDTDKVWFLGTGGDLTIVAFDPSYNVELKYLPYDQDGDKVSPSDGGLTNIDVDMDYRERRPYPPTFIEWNSGQYPATVDITGDVVVDYNRRDYRILNEYSQHAVDASTINGDFPANNDTRYRLKLYDGAAVVYTAPWNASGAATYTMEFVKILRYLDGLPITLKMSVGTRHTFSAVDYEAFQDVLWEASVQSSAYDDDFWLGVLSPSTASNVWTAPQTGTYAFTVASNLLGDGNPTGNLVGVTASDTIEVQHLDSTSTDEVLLTIAAPSGTEDGYGVIVFA